MRRFIIAVAAVALAIPTFSSAAAPIQSQVYLAPNGLDYADDVAIAEDGSTYTVGYLDSTLFPTTPGAFQPATGGLRDVIVIKNRPDGSTEWATYLGGRNTDQGLGIAMVPDGIAIVGNTGSPTFPTTAGVYSRTYQDGDAFVAIFSQSGSLLRSTYLGGTSVDMAWQGAAYEDGRIIVSGYTWSSDFPTTDGTAVPPNHTRGYDAFVAIVSADLKSVTYGTVFGSSSADYPIALGVTPSGTIAVGGYSIASDLPYTGALQPYGGGEFDGWIGLIDPTEGITRFTSLGGDRNDQIHDLAVGPNGEIAVTGFTSSLDFPTTPGALRRAHPSGDYDGFVTVYEPDLSAVRWSTLVGGSRRSWDPHNDGLATDTPVGVSFDASGRVVFGMWTQSLDNVITPDAAQPTMAGDHLEGYIGVLNSTGSAIEYGTFLGGALDDLPYSIAVRGSKVAMVGYTDSPWIHGAGPAGLEPPAAPYIPSTPFDDHNIFVASLTLPN